MGLAMYKDKALRVESVRFKEHPFTFKLSEKKVGSRKRNPGKPRPSVSCSFCGSVKILGDANNRNFERTGRAFCDEDCACNWKSIYYASPNHKPMEDLRQQTKAKKAMLEADRKRKVEEREIKKLITPPNAKSSGYVTCVECKKTIWVDQHSQKKYCSVECSRKAFRKTEAYKELRRESKRNRDHIKRSRGIGDKITIPELLKKFKRRCVNCRTVCVKPEGYNWDNEATIDHVLPIAKGGLHIWSNVQLLCRRCNVAKSDRVLPGTQLMLDLRFK